MLNFSKQILQKVSFDANLFAKELRKLIIWSGDNNRNKLYEWCYKTYGDVYGEIINEVFHKTNTGAEKS